MPTIRKSYLIVPANNVDSRSVELDNIERFGKENNLALNCSRIVEIVITDRKKVSCQSTTTAIRHQL